MKTQTHRWRQYLSSSLIIGLLSGSSIAAAIDLNFDPVNLDFGGEALESQSNTRTLTINNPNTETLDLVSVDILGNVTTNLDAFGTISTTLNQFGNALGTSNSTIHDEFYITADNCSGQVLKTDENCTLEAIFQPKTLGSKTTSLIVLLDALGTRGTFRTFLFGQGTSGGVSLSLDPDTLNFETQAIGGESATQFVSIGSLGQDDLVLGDISLTGDNFIISADPCSGQSLSSGSACQVGVKFSPSNAGSATATLDITSNDAQNPNVSVTLSGVGGESPDILATPNAISFDTVPAGAVAHQLLLISNNGQGVLQLGDITVSNTDFTVDTSVCENTTLDPLGVCTLVVNFEPQATGTSSAELSITSNDPDTAKLIVPLSGNSGSAGDCSDDSLHNLDISPLNIDFGKHSLGNIEKLRVSLKSSTTGCPARVFDPATAVINGTDAEAFGIDNVSCYSGAFGADNFFSCEAIIQFKPNTEGNKAAQLSLAFTESALTPATLDLQGVAIEGGSAVLAVNPDTLDFGNTVLGERPRLELTLTNQGNTNLRLKRPTIIGQDGKRFHVHSKGCRRGRGGLEPGESCTLKVRFSARKIGEKTAKLLILQKYGEVLATIPVSASVVDALTCESINITASNSGDWDDAENWDENRIPSKDDVVSIPTGFWMQASKKRMKIRGLCVAQGGTLSSEDGHGSSLRIKASQFIDNQGQIIGQDGLSELPNETCSRRGVGREGCAYRGSSVILKVTGPINNTGEISAGSGGNANRFPARGGKLVIKGQEINNEGKMAAGDGGDLNGTDRSRAARGGKVMIKASWRGEGSLYNQDGAKILAGDGGECNEDATENQRGGRGGKLTLIADPELHLDGGLLSAGLDSDNCRVPGGRGDVNIDPVLVNLSGANTQIIGNNISISGGDDMLVDMSNTRAGFIQADGDVSINTGSQGSLDMTGSASGSINASGQVQIFSNDMILDENRTVSQVTGNANTAVGAGRILYAASLTGIDTAIGTPTSVLTLDIELNNDGSNTDTYTLSFSDTAAWSISGLPSSITVDGLDSSELNLQVNLPADNDVTNTLTLLAQSQQDSSVLVTLDVLLVSTTDNISNLIACPSSGVIEGLCDNRGRTIQDAQLRRSATVQGGTLSGSISSDGLISQQVNIAANTLVDGGDLSGNIINQGTLRNFNLRGGSVRGGQAGGNISNAGELSDVNLDANAQISGGQVSSNITGDANAYARLNDLKVASNATLRHVIIGDNVNLNAASRLDAIRFKNKAGIPAGRNLLEALPKLNTNALVNQGFEYPLSTVFSGIANLNNDLLEGGDGLIAAINALAIMQDNGFSLTQDSEFGALRVETGDFSLAVLAIDISSSDAPAGIEVLGHQRLRLHTGKGLGITVQAMLHRPDVLHTALSVDTDFIFEIQTDGTIRAYIEFFYEAWLAGQADWIATEVIETEGVNEGIQSELSPYGGNRYLNSVYYRDSANRLMRQEIAPAPALRDQFEAAVSNLEYGVFGLVSFTHAGENYTGVFDYLVNANQIRNGTWAISNVADANEDGVGDYLITYANGERQFLFARSIN